ncbi:MAG: sigma-70 family RNA polymerase sigma factor [Oscillospiraceae bacterium]|nr:sigma-70 family RNA polymerase sigma factor [Oscillospiraceae bacterium]
MNKRNDVEFVEKYSSLVYKLALTRTRDLTSADDVFQDVFFRYFKKRPSFLSDEHEKAWIIRVTINCSKSMLGSLWKKRMVPLDESLAVDQPEVQEVYDVIMQLPLKYRTVIFLHYYEGFTISNIAKATKTKENTVKSHLFRARSLLKERLADYEF